MTEQERLAAALEYQQAQQPARMNPNLAAQGARGRENMMPPTSVMDERYPAFKRNQEDAEKLMLGLDIVGSAIPLAGPAMKGAKILGQAAAPQIAQALENYTFKTGMALPIDVYHGSPHRFAATAKNPLGEFDPTKIGSGEGAQAYGYGHYLAENPGIGKSYAMALGPKTARTDPQYLALNERLGKFEEKLAKRYNMGEEVISPLEEVIFTPDKYPKRVVNAAHKLSDAEDAAYKSAAKGTLYKVDLPDEAIPRMLDWDKPLSQQSKEVKSIADKLGVKARVNVSENPNLGGFQMVYSSGGDIVDAAIAKFGSKEAASEFLRKEGIPGIQYLDAGSRGAGTGTRNFVVFPGNEGLLNILGRE